IICSAFDPRPTYFPWIFALKRDPDRSTIRISSVKSQPGTQLHLRVLRSGPVSRLGSTLRCTAVAAFTRAAAVGTLLPAGIVFLAHFRVAAAAALHIAAVFAAV